jgi:phosphatidylinositol N-acetylglucosaminyltransferase subunit C
LHSTGSKTLKSSILVFLVLMALAPVLRTLSAATSSDSIWALSAVLFVLNSLLADYTPAPPDEYAQTRYVFPFIILPILDTERIRLTSVLSMNAAMSASVVLASRLSDDISVFALVLSAVELFALYPMLRRKLQVSRVCAHIPTC